MVDLSQGLVGDIEIDAGRCNAGVAKQALNGDKIGSTLKQSSRKVVTKNVRCEFSFR